MTTRRHFLLASAAGAVALASRARAADAVTLGLIGAGGMGVNHLKYLAKRSDARVAFICDPDADRFAVAAKTLESGGKPTPKMVRDIREVLDDRAVDGVIVVTPDHWHAPATILALAAGKHVYVEKPCCHNLREGRLMVEAARKANRVVQVGTQSRSSPVVRKAIDRLREGAIGEVLTAKAWNSQLRKNLGHAKPADPPKSLDYDLWLGPAPFRPYQANMLPSVWRFFRDFGTGDIGNDGAHELDIARWGLGVAGLPAKVVGLGGKLFFDDDQEFPDSYTVAYEYGTGPKPKQLVYEQRIWSPYVQEGHENGVAFYGTTGYMVLGKGNGWQTFGPKNKPLEKVDGRVDLALHHDNFIECVRGGKKPSAEIEDGHLSAALAHLGNIACRVGRTLYVDSANERILNDPEADAQLKRTYRKDHWAAPKGA
ncbi:MAG: Gfo/Idh/MocA family oxidoreductase [Gemmataceae bacterium]